MTDSFFQTMNKKYGSINKNQLAQNVFKNSVNIGEAVVNVLGNFGVAGFRFNIPLREQVKLENEVTDHYVDTNTPVQDNIASKPVTLTLTGLQGEYFYSVNEIKDALANVTPILSLVKQFTPKLSSATKQIKQKYQESEQGLAAYYASYDKEVPGWQSLVTFGNSLNGMDLFQIFQNLYKLKSAQTRAFLFFEALWKSQAIFSLECSWKVYQNMVVTNVTALRDENADITDFTVSFKQINFVQSLVRSYDNAAGRTREQLVKTTNKGVDKGKEVKTV